MDAALRKDHNFRWFMGGAVLSGMGDQFTLIALPWLVLQMTQDPFTLGTVLALLGIPRAVFILFGGALVDRFSPIRVLMWTKYANTVLLAALSALLLAGQLSLAMLYGFALALGLASAFSIPAGTSILPTIVPAALLQQGNAMLMALRQLTMLAGPLLGGFLVAFGGQGYEGIAFAFAFDAFSFAFSGWTLVKVTPLAARSPGAAQQSANVLASVLQGLRSVWRDAALRWCFIYWGLVTMVVGGGMQVALPVLANSRLSGAEALGILLGVHGGGTLVGMLCSKVFGRLRIGTFGTTLLVVDVVVGLLLLPLGLATALWQALLLLLPLGILAGYMQVAVYTWVQQRAPRDQIGRTMSIFMFIFMGLTPLSAAVVGWLLRHLDLATLFSASGLFLISTATLAWLTTPIRRIEVLK
jgi:MFS family permease